MPQLVDLICPSIHSVFRSAGLNHFNSEPLCRIPDNNSSHCLKSSIFISLCCCADDFSNILIKLERLFMLISWRPHDPVLLNYFLGSWGALRCIKVLGSVGLLQARLFSCLTKSNLSALHCTLLRQAFHSCLMNLEATLCRPCCICIFLLSLSIICFLQLSSLGLSSQAPLGVYLCGSICSLIWAALYRRSRLGCYPFLPHLLSFQAVD